MTIARYSLCAPNQRSAVGTSTLRESRGSLIDTSGCVLLLVTAGCAICSVNFKRHALRKGDMALFFYDEVFQMERTSAAFAARYVALSYDLAEEAILDVPSPHFWDIVYGFPAYHASHSEWALLNGWWQHMEWMAGAVEANYRDAMLKTHFHSILLALDSWIARMTLSPLRGDVNRQWKLVTDFFRLLGRHCRETRDVQFYAGKLCITTSYLYKLCQKVLQSSPKELIDKETVSEIKAYLTNTDLTVKRIAEEMHFEGDSYLCRYFRRQTGMSPIAYRNSAAEGV